MLEFHISLSWVSENSIPGLENNPQCMMTWIAQIRPSPMNIIHSPAFSRCRLHGSLSGVGGGRWLSYELQSRMLDMEGVTICLFWAGCHKCNDAWCITGKGVFRISQWGSSHISPSVAYLGFPKGGPNFLWPLVLTWGGKPCFPIFSYGKKKIPYAPFMKS